jgi:hypothetical protein
MEQLDLIETAEVRSLLDQLLDDSKLYRTGADFKALLDFVVRLRNFAPFNAMLLEIQKPGLTYAASALDWRERFGRTVKKDARPLLILWPFAPVAFVYDIQDTEGEALPLGVSPFVTEGRFDEVRLMDFTQLLAKKSIHWISIDAGGSYQAFVTASVAGSAAPLGRGGAPPARMSPSASTTPSRRSTASACPTAPPSGRASALLLSLPAPS